MGAMFTVAAKEFRDHLASKRFLMVFAVLMLLSVVGVIAGVDDYNRELSHYKDRLQQMSDDPAYQRSIAELQQQIASGETNGLPQEQIDRLKEALSEMTSPPMPSVLLVFRNFNVYFSIIGAVLAVSLGFDLITREKEEGSLKSLLIHPVYRDEVINGKALGSLAVLAIVLLSAFMITLAVMLLDSVVPSGEDLLSLAAYMVIALIYGAVFFGISLAASTVARGTGMSVAYLTGVVVLMVLIPTVINSVVVFAMGPAPEVGQGPAAQVPDAAGETAVTISGPAPAVADAGGPINQTTYEDRGREYAKYWETRGLITGIVDVINPMADLNQAAGAVLGSNVARGFSLTEAISKAWTNIIVLIAMAVAAFAFAYVKFLRLDVR